MPENGNYILIGGVKHPVSEEVYKAHRSFDNKLKYSSIVIDDLVAAILLISRSLSIKRIRKSRPYSSLIIIHS